MKYADRLRELRIDADMSQKDIAWLLSCSQQMYSKYERGISVIPPETLIRLADLYGISIDYLLGRINKR